MPPILAMSVFALALSASPGPVNVLTLSTGSNHGAVRAFPFVTGATISFSLLLLAIGLGLGALVEHLGMVFDLLAVMGAALICYFGYKLATSNGAIMVEQVPIPTFWNGAALQLLNPKAWGACTAAVAIFELQASRTELLIFVGLYSVICFFGIGAWAVIGQQAKRLLTTSTRMLWFNRLLGSTLVLLAVVLLTKTLAG